MKRILNVVILVLLFFNLRAQENSYTLTFSIDNMGIETAGSFNEVQADITFDPAFLNRSSIVATANVLSVASGIALRDKHLKRRDYFDVETYPLIRLKSTSFRKLKNNVYEGSFELTIKDVTRIVRIPITVRRERGKIMYKGKFEINRLDFGLGDSSPVLDENVKVTVQAIEYGINDD